MSDLIEHLFLLQSFGAGDPKLLKLLKKYGSAKEVYNNLGERDIAATLTLNERSALRKSSIDLSQRIFDYCEKNKIHLIAYDDERYPARLRETHNPPSLLFACGNVSALSSPLSIAVVGTRTPSEYSVGVASKMCRALAESGVTVVSSMGYGIDSISHAATARAGGTVIGVLPCGMAFDYPRDTIARRRAIFEAGGVVVSELMPGVPCVASYFKLRNRIVAGLADGVLLVEFKEKSGCHYTAHHAVMQDRDVFCIPPHDILDERYNGVWKYLRDGATPVFEVDDILARFTYMADKPEDAEEKATETDETEETTPPREVSLDDFDGDEKIIVSMLKDGPLWTDILGETEGIEDLYTALMELEGSDIIRPIGGGRYELIAVLKEREQD